tara:strand:+ start:1311 stop:1889 length:579 start_codon:yes stop_codon:yes gene_type:complete
MAGYSNTISETLNELKKKNDIYYFVETGTFQGDTTKLAQNIFNKVYTIELNNKLYNKARKNLASDSTLVLHGDSASVLNNILNDLDKNSLFFLDAHWAGDLSSKGETDTPLWKELNVIKQRDGKYNDVIVIDDISWLGKKDKIIFKSEWKSKYYPNGGTFEYDWSDIKKSDVKNLFHNKKIIEVDDRMIIYT